jgi:translation initiation factor IF-1
MKRLLSIMSVFSILILLFVMTGCEPKVNVPPNVTLEGAIISSGNTTVALNETEIKPNENNTSSNVSETSEYENAAYTITATEGDLVVLKLKAVDPDGLPLTYYYSAPFNDKGLWQTTDGDVGKYLVKVTAADQFINTSADVLVVVNPSNKAPVIDCPEDINVREGETVDLDCKFFDKENDPIVVEYSGWMTSPTYTTGFESAGTHKVFVRASDPTHNVTKTILVNVENVARAPIFLQHFKDMTVTESDIVTLNPNVTEPDQGEIVIVKYSEPFDSNGVWKTKIDDAGVYPISVVATSQGLSTKETFTLTVKMLTTPPVMALIPNMTVSEGDTVTIKPEAKDRQNNPITFEYSGWISDSSYTTTYDDAYPKGCDKPGCTATYKITVKASNGLYDVSQDVYVTVKDKNRPPVFVWPTSP